MSRRPVSHPPSALRHPHPVLVIGAGPAGLATAAELARRGVPYRLFERGPSLGTSWLNAYDSLCLHTGRHMSTLPGHGYQKGTPLFPTRDQFVAYLCEYADRHGLRIETSSDVSSVRKDAGGWIAQVNGAEVRGSAVVMATGIMSKPVIPDLPGREAFGGEVIHSVEYRRPGPFAGRRVLVVGVGNSGGEIASELGLAGIAVTILVRRGANVVPREIAGVPIQYLAAAMKRLPLGARRRVARLMQRVSELRNGPAVLPRPPWTAADAVPVIGFHLVDAIRSGKVALKTGTIESLEPGGVRFADGSRGAFDAIILATGFEPALDPLGSLVRRDERGFALRTDNVTSADHEGLLFVGQRYDTTGAIANIKVDAVAVGRQLRVEGRGLRVEGRG
jgi:cation diffusion facilitator CzcD-associated flavoprotein CzcO